MNQNKEFKRALKPEPQAFDEIRIITRPYLKDSGFSGTEWRTRTYTEFYRKGELVFTDDGYTSMEYAVRLLDHSYIQAIDAGHALFAGEGNFCDQEGCSKQAAIVYECIEDRCDRCGTIEAHDYYRPYRKFCQEHHIRGDSRFGDIDEHYVMIDDPELKE